jgi:NitT/TauT family transport system substrate-binding protein
MEQCICRPSRWIHRPVYSARGFAAAFAIGVICCGGYALAASDQSASGFTLRVGYQPYYAEAWSGVLVRELRLYEGRLPPNVRTEFLAGTIGADVLVSALRRGEIDVAYLGLAPTLTVTQDLSQGDFRIIGVSSVSPRLCNVIIAQAGAPALNSPAALQWLAGKRIAVPRGSCADLFLADVLEKGQIAPALVFNQSIDVLSASLKTGAVDAVAVWEPVATHLVRTTGAVRLLDGDGIEERSAAFIVARGALLRDHADVVLGWLTAERAAELLLASDPETIATREALARQASGLSRETLLAAWASASSPNRRHAPPAIFPFVVTPEVSVMLHDAAARMAHRGLLTNPSLRAETIADGATRQVLSAARDRNSPSGGTYP